MTGVERLVLKPDEVAEMLGISRAYVYQLIRSEAIPTVKIGKTIRVPVHALRAWVDQRLAERQTELGVDWSKLKK